MPPAGVAPGDAVEAAPGRGLGLVLAVAVLAAAVMAIVALSVHFGYPYDIEPGEGDRIYTALRLLRGEPLYSKGSDFPYLYNVYPPVYALAVAPLVATLGPVLAAGRLVSLLGTLGASVVLARWLRDRGAGPPLQAAGAVGFAACVMLVPYQLSCRPDALAAWAGCGTLAYADAIRRRNLGHGHLTLLAGLGLVASFTRQSMPLLVVAALASLWPSRRWRAAAALAGCGCVGLALVLMLDHVTAGAFWASITSTVSWSRRAPEKWAFLVFYFLLSQWGWTLLVMGGVTTAAMRRAVPPAAWLGLLAASYEALGITRAGAAANYLLPFHFFMVTIGALVAAETIRRGSRRWSMVATVVVAAQLAHDAVQLRFEARAVPPWGLAAARSLEAALRPIPGPMLLDRQTEMWLRLGRLDHFVEVAGLGLDVLHGGGHTEPLQAFIRAGGYSRIVLRRHTLLPGRVLDAVRVGYRETGRVRLFDDEYVILAPAPR